MNYVSKPGFTPTRTYRSRKYPLELLAPGEMLDPPFPMSEMARVKFAVQRWNKQNPDSQVSINFYPIGTSELKEPHFVVGRSPTE